MAEKAAAITPRIAELTRKLQKEPGSRVFLELAREYHAAGSFEDAARVCREGLAKHAGYHSARVLLGRSLLDLRRFAEARPELEKVVQQAPDNLLARRLLVEALLGTDEITAALDTLRTLLRLNPSDTEVESLIREIENPPEGARPEPARDDGQTVEDPAEAVTAALEPGAFALAETTLEAAKVPESGQGSPMPVAPGDRKPIGSHPEPEPVAAVAAAPVATSAQTVAMRPDEVMAALNGPAGAAETAIEAPPPRAASRRERPASSAARTRPGASEAVGTESLASATVGGTGAVSDGAIPTPTLAEIYLRQGMPERALSVYEKLLESNPNDPGTVGRWKDLRAKLHSGSEGGADGRPRPQDPEGAGGVIPTPTLAEIYLAQGETERAVGVLRLVLEGDPDNDEVRARLRDLGTRTAPVSSLNDRKIHALQSWMERIRRAHDQDRAGRVGPPASGV